MIRGTTPTLNFTLPFEVSIIEKLWITFSQSDLEVFTLTNERCEMNEHTIKVTLTQEETLQFKSSALVEIQLRVLDNSDTAVASDIIRVPVQRILKGDVI